MLTKFIISYIRKIKNKLTGYITIKTTTKKVGSVLLSYTTEPFIQSPKELITDPHSSYWECKEIVRILNNKGYDVDIVNWWNKKFIPHKKYSICIDVQQNLEKFSKFLNKECIKIMHIVGANSEFQNNSENKRLEELYKRKKISIKPRRQVEINKNEYYADFIEGFGNKTIFDTYAKAKKDIFPINESVTKTFDFPNQDSVNKMKKNFLWFGGGGAVHKGLDLVIEAISNMPDIKLHIIGPIQKELDFITLYKKELSQENIKIYNRPKIDKNGDLLIDGINFFDITKNCSSIIYPSCSEGTSGAVIQAMHAGLIPIITPETGISEKAPAIIINNPTVEKIKSTIIELISKSDEEIKKMAYDNWSFARSFYTKEEFTRTYSNFINSILK